MLDFHTSLDKDTTGVYILALTGKGIPPNTHKIGEGQILARTKSLTKQFAKLSIAAELVWWCPTYGEGVASKVEHHVHARLDDFRVFDYSDISTEVFSGVTLEDMTNNVGSMTQVLENIKRHGGVMPKATSDRAIQLILNELPAGSRVLNPCSGAGLLGKALAEAGHEVLGVEIDHNNMPNGLNYAVLHGDFMSETIEKVISQMKHDAVIINPPFSNRSATGSATSGLFYKQFILHAQEFVAPGGVLVFIAPDGWESMITSKERAAGGRYTVIAKSVEFVDAPSASIVKWEPGFAFEVIGGREDAFAALPKPPKQFNVKVLSSGNHKATLKEGQWAVPRIGTKIKRPGDTMHMVHPAFEGPDAEEAVRWLLANRDAIANAYGKSANGVFNFGSNNVKVILGLK